MKFLSLVLMCLLSLPSLANPAKAQTTATEDLWINANYPLFINAFTQLSPAVIREIYAEDASYLSESQSKEIYSGRDAIVSIYQTFFDK
ncbi:MAG: DUF4440 domain-containing protein, partial [Shewanella sp.]